MWKRVTRPTRKKERSQQMLFTEERPSDVGIWKALCVLKGIMNIKNNMEQGDHVVHCFEPHKDMHIACF